MVRIHEEQVEATLDYLGSLYESKLIGEMLISCTVQAYMYEEILTEISESLRHTDHYKKDYFRQLLI